MAKLEGQSIASSYDQLLHVDTEGGGNTTTHVSVKDGNNDTTFALTLATDAVMITSTNRLEFGDDGTYIHQSADGVLDLVSDTEIEINATTIDINGAVAMDGAITGATDITLSGELDAATLDISGNADIDGTTNLDIVDIDGAVDMASTLSIGDAVTITKDTDAEFVASILVNQSDAADTTGIISQRFDLEDTGGNAVDSGKILVGKEASFTATGSTQDSYMALHTSLNGTLAEKVRIDSSGNVGIGVTDPGAVCEIKSADQNLWLSSTSDTGNPILKFLQNDTQRAYIQYTDNSGDEFLQFVCQEDPSYMRFIPGGGVVAMSIASGGDVTFAGDLIMADGKGIDFSADASPASGMTAEILDDYETGTWDAVVTDGSNPMTMSSDAGYYTKVGNLVHVSGHFETSSLGSASGAIRITGLPFTIANNGAAYSGGGAALGQGFAISAGHAVSCYGLVNNTYIKLQVWDATTGISDMQASEWTADGAIIIGFSYRAA